MIRFFYERNLISQRDFGDGEMKYEDKNKQELYNTETGSKSGISSYRRLSN